ncbi:MAG TPA: ABC transporter ATP-binding protein [Streptosporangiaceae bacterium]|jgi:oligopeptide/dipeptide ABC transporter ATP-binding protein
MSLLEVKDLTTSIVTRRGTVHAVQGVSFGVERGSSVCVVGESGSGKSVMARSIIRLLPREARIVSGSVVFDGTDLRTLPEKRLEDLRGMRIGMLFQDPMSCLNPVLTIGTQITETIRRHLRVPRAEAYKRAVELLGEVRIDNAERRMADYPHQYSGGMRQRVMLAIALSCDPDLLIADEPTTALDVTVQARILDLLEDLRQARGLALLLITHDMRIVERVADQVLVMYAGQIVESGKRKDVLGSPQHPYTEALLGAVPDIDDSGARTSRLTAIPGSPPDLTATLAGCRFAPRCGYARLDDGCASAEVELRAVGAGHLVRSCHPAIAREAKG